MVYQQCHQFLMSPPFDTKVFFNIKKGTVTSVEASYCELRVEVPTFHFHVTQELKIEKEWGFVDLK